MKNLRQKNTASVNWSAICTSPAHPGLAPHNAAPALSLVRQPCHHILPACNQGGAKRRPSALRPTLSDGLPFSDVVIQFIFIDIPTGKNVKGVDQDKSENDIFIPLLWRGGVVPLPRQAAKVFCCFGTVVDILVQADISYRCASMLKLFEIANNSLGQKCPNRYCRYRFRHRYRHRFGFRSI
jgi:hypothetical protein